jgi:hypothetical protein
MNDNTIENALTRLARARRKEQKPEGAPTTFRAVIEERLRSVERQLDELKGRVNGLLFLLAGAVATEIVLRLLR